MKFFQNPKLRYKKILIVVIPLFIALIVMLFLAYNSIIGTLGVGTSVSSEKTYDIEIMDYHLRSNATDYQIEIFEELNEAVKEMDEQKIVECVAKNYIADVYTWSNKKDKWDVGGMSYVYSKFKTITYYEIRDTLYQLMARSKRLYEDNEQLCVTNVEVLSCKKNEELFEIDSKYYEAYDVECTINYTGNDKVKGVMTSRQYLTIIKNTDQKGRYEIAVSYGDQ